MVREWPPLLASLIEPIVAAVSKVTVNPLLFSVTMSPAVLGAPFGVQVVDTLQLAELVAVWVVFAAFNAPAPANSMTPAK